MEWRWTALKTRARDRIYNCLGSLGSRAFINLRWPWPLRKPYQRKQLVLRPPGVGVGDNLMCTPILREIKRRNPDCRITFLTRHPELFKGNLNIDTILSDYTTKQDTKATRLGYDHMCPYFTAERLLAKGIEAYRQAARGRLYFGYAHPKPPSHPLISMMAACVGLDFFDPQLDCALPSVSDAFREKITVLGQKYIVIQTHASDWTPNKDWPASHWSELAQLLVNELPVVEVGTRSLIGSTFHHPRFHCFAGQTSISEFLYLVREAKVFIGPDSGGMHVANAFQVPTVIIHGGYTSPDSFRYPNLIPLYTPVECAPCWLTTPCPYQIKCQAMISPQQVLVAVRQALSGKTA